MKINELRECVVLAETLSFTETARRLYTTQSALSKHIQALERDLDAQLFIRDHNGVQMTRLGESFVADAKEVISQYEQMLVNLNRTKSGIDSVVVVGYLAGASMAFLPDVVAEFSETHPNVELELQSMEIDGIVEGMETGTLDFAVTYNFIPVPTSRFSYLPLYKDAVNVIVPKDHRLAGRKSVSVMDLAGETVLLAGPSFMTREASFFKNLLQPVSANIIVRESLRDFMSLFAVMRSGRYVSLFFNHSSHFGDNAEHFDFIPLKEAPDAFNIIAMWDKSRETAAILDLAQALQEAVDTDGFWH